jgi:acetyl-CoA carboxylase carboxyltransferase component
VYSSTSSLRSAVGSAAVCSSRLYRMSTALRKELVDEYTDRFSNPYQAAERGIVDDVIDPADTRIKLIAGLDLLRSKREDLPHRKHGNIPL